MGKVKFVSPIARILGKLGSKDEVYYRRFFRGSDVVFSVRRQKGSRGEMCPRQRLTCDLMTFVNGCVSEELRERRGVWADDFEYYLRDCELFKGMRRFSRLRDYVFHIIYVAVIEYFRDEIGGDEPES